LKKRLLNLKNAYINQRDEERTWEEVDLIINLLETALKFLEYPDVKS
jgi:hypothetical protein